MGYLSISLNHLQFPLQLAAYVSFASLIRFIPKYFIYLFIFEAILKGFLKTFPLWYFIISIKKCKDFCMLILYPAMWLNSFIIFSSFCVESLGFSIYSIMSPVCNNFASFWPIWILLIYFSFLTALPRIPVLCWVEVVRMGITVLFQSLVGRLSAFYCWVLCWLWVCHSSFLLCWNRSLYAHSGESFFFMKSQCFKSLSWSNLGQLLAT